MVDLHAIILTNTEEIHLQRCLASIRPICGTITVLDSGSADGTIEIAKSFGADVITNEYVNHSPRRSTLPLIISRAAVDGCFISTRMNYYRPNPPLASPSPLRKPITRLPSFSCDAGFVLWVAFSAGAAWIQFGSFVSGGKGAADLNCVGWMTISSSQVKRRRAKRS
jgi:hypothetical protein